jgi:hypothetical protein
MLEQNTIYNLRVLEKYFTDVFIDIRCNAGAILKTKDDVFAQKVIEEFLTDQIKRMKSQIAEKEK